VESSFFYPNSGKSTCTLLPHSNRIACSDPQVRELNPALQCGEETWCAEWRHEVQKIEPRTSVRGGKMVCWEETWSAE